MKSILLFITLAVAFLAVHGDPAVSLEQMAAQAGFGSNDASQVPQPQQQQQGEEEVEATESSVASSFIENAPVAINQSEEEFSSELLEADGHAISSDEDEAPKAVTLGPKGKQQQQKKRVTPQRSMKGASVMNWPRGNSLKLSCDLVSKSGLCLFGGRKVIVPDANPVGQVARIQFNELLQGQCIDSSGNSNHGNTGPENQKELSLSLRFPKVANGPDRSGSGSSASFDGSQHVTVPDSASIRTLHKQYSASFWVYIVSGLLTDAPAEGCPLLVQLDNDTKQAASQLLLKQGSKLEFSLKSSKGDFKIESAGRYRLNQWTHIAVQAENNNMRLYVNGVVDAQGNGTFDSPKASSWYVGAGPIPDAKCAWRGYVDDLRLSNKVTTPVEIAAESFPSLGGIEATYAALGCSATKPCALKAASQTCVAMGRHLCSKNEHASGAAQVSRIMGWNRWSDAFWYLDDANLAKAPADAWTNKMALCCQ